jgi:predicted enzyme related to lactoylglutathione lyase
MSDVDRAKKFYDQVGFVNVHDNQISPQMRVVQLTPPGSTCAIVFGTGIGPVTEMEPRSVKGVHLVVDDIEEARSALIERGVEIGTAEDLGGGVMYAWCSDPDGNLWTQQWPK